MLYGRDRPYAGVPYTPPTKMLDAVAYFQRQEEVDHKIAKVLNDLHAKRAEQENRRRREPPSLNLGDKVWYLRPRGRPGEKLETYWVGPAIVRERTGEHSYRVEIQPGRLQDAHRCQLKEHREDFTTKPLKLFRYRQTEERDEAHPDEWVVEKIGEHRRRPDGDLEFKVKWEGSAQETWEPLHHFFHR